MQDSLHFVFLGSEEVELYSDDVLPLAELHHLDSLIVHGLACFHVSEVLLASLGSYFQFPMGAFVERAGMDGSDKRRFYLLLIAFWLTVDF